MGKPQSMNLNQSCHFFQSKDGGSSSPLLDVENNVGEAE
jgi:hypothetical protein